jgi:hypothetical protein
MYPIELIESRLGDLSERAFQATAPAPGASGVDDEDATRQRILKLVDDEQADRVSSTDLTEAIDARLVEETGDGYQLTSIGRYALRRADAASSSS